MNLKIKFTAYKVFYCTYLLLVPYFFLLFVLYLLFYYFYDKNCKLKIPSIIDVINTCNKNNYIYIYKDMV